MNWRACAVALVLLAGCQPSASDGKSVPLEVPANAQKAIFAGGCFWCTESDFEKLPGVVAAVSGYTGGHTENVRYEDSLNVPFMVEQDQVVTLTCCMVHSIRERRAKHPIQLPLHAVR